MENYRFFANIEPAPTPQAQMMRLAATVTAVLFNAALLYGVLASGTQGQHILEARQSESPSGAPANVVVRQFELPAISVYGHVRHA